MVLKQEEYVTISETIAYLDNNATTQCAPEVVDVMLPFFAGKHGNPSSPHIYGRQAERAVSVAREQIAESISCNASDIHFTSGATESNNLIILGMAGSGTKRRKIVTSAIEHKSVLGPCESLRERGYEVRTLPVTKGGVIDIEAARNLIDESTLLVSVQGANNEIGTLQPVSAIADIAHEKGAALHCDAAQLLGKVPVALGEIHADFLSFSSHKAYGPKGIGFIVVRNQVRSAVLRPILYGGGQENGFRPGTLNVPGIVGTGEACRLIKSGLEKEMRRVAALRQSLEDGVRKLMPESRAIASGSPRLPGTTCLMFPSVPGDLLISRTPTVCMSLGSACNSGSFSPSHVLLALGLSREEAKSAVRFSIGRYNRVADVQTALSSILEALHDL
jgi:cysteine desulfurase